MYNIYLNTDVLLTYLYLMCFSAPGGSMFGDVNISAILDSFSASYDKRVRPNYGGEFDHFIIIYALP